MHPSRRSFIRYASLAAAGHLAGLAPFGALNSLAESSGDYKALVCIFLFGGNDSNNMVVPFDQKRYASYSAIRGPLALPQNSLLQFAKSPSYSMHPALPDLRALYDSGHLGIVANVGNLVEPLTIQQYRAGGLTTPANLFSHPDQQAEWQNGLQNGGSTTGWGGRIADLLSPVHNPNGLVPLVSSVAGDPVFCNGSITGPLTITPGAINTGECFEGPSCSGRIAAEQQLITLPSGLSLVQADKQIMTKADQYVVPLKAALSAVSPLKTVFSARNSLSVQLQQIIQIIEARQSLGLNRQIFFASLGSFDTHVNQLETQDALLAKLNDAMYSFYSASQELNLASQITTFTMSDFARAFEPNSKNGTDHAWGGHHLVMGGAVSGGNIYGRFPELALGGPDDVGSNGRWIPSTASVQYASTLASWFGVPSSSLSSIFPLLSNFKSQDLGFLS